MAHTKCMFLPLKAQNPAREADPRQNHREILWFGLWRGSATGVGFYAFKGKNVYLVMATAQFSQSGAHRRKGEKLKMALKVSESAKLAYYRWNLKLFGPSRAPLDPSGGKSDHPMALICR